MAKNTQLSNTSATVEANAFGALFNNGYLRIYTGLQPANANTALSGQTLLVELQFPATAFPTAVNGVLTANSITPVLATATGTAAWFRCLQSDGTTVIMDGTCDVSSNTPNLTLPTTSIVQNVTVGVSSFTHTVNLATAGY